MRKRRSLIEPLPNLAMADPLRINLKWLIRLRLGTAVGQTSLVAFSIIGLDIQLPLYPIFGLLFVEFVSNVFAAYLYRKKQQHAHDIINSLLFLDVIIITGLLYYCGGPSNPFAVLYLVHITLASLFTSRFASWLLLVVSALLFAGLYVKHIPLVFNGALITAHESGFVELHRQGLWLAFVTTAIFITYFLQHVSQNLYERELTIAAYRERENRHEKVTALATLAAGAAHELSTPLATISLIAHDLRRSLNQNNIPLGQLQQDAITITAQLERCKNILSSMAGEAGIVQGAPLQKETVACLIQKALEPFPSTFIVLHWTNEVRDALLHLPFESVVIALRSLIKNALQAAPTKSIEILVSLAARSLRIAIKDQGPGMPEEVLSHLAEPFFTTKEAGQGMGLGLFLSKTVIEKLHGKLDVVSHLGKGTEVSLEIPIWINPA